MKRPTFQEKTEVKVVSREYNAFMRVNGTETTVPMYGWRGTVKEIAGFDAHWNLVEKPYSPESYPENWEVVVEFTSPADGKKHAVSFRDWICQLEPVQHKFIDIDYIREDDVTLGKKEDGTDIIRPKNTGSFEPGDVIQITTKIDGANASIAWDETTEKLEVFSRTNLLGNPGDLRGFYDYVKSEIEPKADWSVYKDFVFFGEWCVGHTIKDYNKDWFNKWRVYDIWCKSTGCYVSQERVKAICKLLGLEYIEELYFGPFVSWDHCRSFLDKSAAYGPTQEGIVIKNQTKLAADDRRAPAYLKIVNDKFKESCHSKKEKAPVDPAVEAARAKAIELAASVVTEARVRKLIFKLADEGKIPAELGPKDMGAVMKILPKLVFEDVCKEEKTTVDAMNELVGTSGKLISAETAKLARKIVVGS